MLILLGEGRKGSVLCCRCRFAGATSRLAGAAACLYTVPLDRGFIVDRHPATHRVLVVRARMPKDQIV